MRYEEFIRVIQEELRQNPGGLTWAEVVSDIPRSSYPKASASS